MDTENTHVPSLNTACVDEEGSPSSREEEMYGFLDDYVKNVTEATPPEIILYGHPVNAPPEVKLLTVHPDGTIYYTLDSLSDKSTFHFGTLSTSFSVLFVRHQRNYLVDLRGLSEAEV